MRMKPCRKECLHKLSCYHSVEHEYRSDCERSVGNCLACEPVEVPEVINHTAAEVIRELERILTPEYADNDEGIIEHTGDWILLDSQLKRLKEKYLNQEDK